MKMSDGGYRPAYNVQLTTAAQGTHIIGVSVTDQGTDYGLLAPAFNEVNRRYGVTPQSGLADGGYYNGFFLLPHSVRHSFTSSPVAHLAGSRYERHGVARSRQDFALRNPFHRPASHDQMHLARPGGSR